MMPGIPEYTHAVDLMTREIPGRAVRCNPVRGDED